MEFAKIRHEFAARWLRFSDLPAYLANHISRQRAKHPNRSQSTDHFACRRRQSVDEVVQKTVTEHRSCRMPPKITQVAPAPTLCTCNSSESSAPIEHLKCLAAAFGGHSSQKVLADWALRTNYPI